MLTFVNGILFGMETARPSKLYLYLVFGRINMISFGLVTGLGYFMLSFLQVYSKRIVHRIYLSNDFETVYVEFFNAFWVTISRTRNQKQKSSIYQSSKSRSQDLPISLGSS